MSDGAIRTRTRVYPARRGAADPASGEAVLASATMLRASCALGLVLLACNSGPTEPARPATPAPASAPAATAQPVGLGVVELTTGGAAKDATLPLIVALHGLGDRPEAFAGVFDGFASPARILVPRAFDAWGDGYSWFPFRPADGDAQRAPGIERAAERVANDIAIWAKRRPTRGKPIVTGFSQGGMLSFAIAARHPDLVRAAFPIGGVLPEPLWPALDAAKPSVRIVALHGEADERVPLGPTRRGVDALVARGFAARLESFPGVGHGIPPALRARWLELLAAEIAAGAGP